MQKSRSAALRAGRTALALMTLCVVLLPGGAFAQPDRSTFAEPTPSSPIIEPVVIAYHTPDPVPDLLARRFLAEHRGELISCTMVARIDEFGKLSDALGVGCPTPLRMTAQDAVRQWKFHPPTLADKAVAGSYQVHFVFVSHSVRVDSTPVPTGGQLVRTRPMAVPEWPTPPKVNRKARAWFRQPAQEGLSGARCLIDFQVNREGLMEREQVVDCPPALTQSVILRARRFGFRVVGAEPGDGSVYRLDMWMSPDGSPPPES